MVDGGGPNHSISTGGFKRSFNHQSALIVSPDFFLSIKLGGKIPAQISVPFVGKKQERDGFNKVKKYLSFFVGGKAKGGRKGYCRAEHVQFRDYRSG